MKIIEVDNEGNFVIKNNRVSVLSGIDAVGQLVQMRLRRLAGEGWFNSDDGIVPQTTIWEGVDDAKVVGFLASVRTVVENTPGVLNILDLSYAIMGYEFQYTIKILVSGNPQPQTVFGQVPTNAA